jgi:menaquinone-dependent protoporphyrinogen oxidase
MTKTLIVYGTVEGHTDKVAASIAAPLQEAGHEVVVRRIGDAPQTPEGFDVVVVGSSVHLGKHHADVVAWARDNAALLSQRPSAFFEVCLSAAADDEQRLTEARTYVDAFMEQTGWHPDLVGIFGGALLYTRYGFVKKRMLRSIAAKGGFGTDTHHDFDYTDYDAVRQFGADIAAAA